MILSFLDLTSILPQAKQTNHDLSKVFPHLIKKILKLPESPNRIRQRPKRQKDKQRSTKHST